jgi:hypothetical protein
MPSPQKYESDSPSLEEVRVRAARLARVTKAVLSDMAAAQNIGGRMFIPAELPDRCNEFRQARASVLEVIGYPEGARS